MDDHKSDMSNVLDLISDEVMATHPRATPEFAALSTVGMSLQTLAHQLCEMGIEGKQPDLAGLIAGIMETLIWVKSKEESFILASGGYVDGDSDWDSQ